MRIFVAGSSGQVALSLKEAATAKGIALETFGRPALDITDAQAVEKAVAAFDPTIIVNAAAYTAVDAAESDESTAFSVNASGAEALARAAATRDIPIIHISTDYVFDGTKNGAYVETDTTAPTGAYGRSKLAGEEKVQAACDKAIILRTAWVYSPFGKNFLKTMLMLAKSRDELGVVADQIGNPTYAPDIADGILAIASRIAEAGWQENYGGVFHMAGTGKASWHEFSEAIFDAGSCFGHPRPKVNAITTADYPTPARRPANSQMDCSRLGEVFDIHMPSWEQSTGLCVKRLFESGELG